MKNRLLLPRVCRPIGWVLFPLAIANLISRDYIETYKYQLPFLYKRYDWKDADGSNWDTLLYDYTIQFAWIFTIITLFMIAFSKQKVEDEYVQSVRLKSLLMSIYVYIAAFILITLYSVGTSFTFRLSNIIPLLLIFILVFNYQLFVKPRFSKSATL